ncbi:hypothetical protein CEQ30_38130 [Nocardia brasiliensis]|nr:hypothetical protein CEQ30_38130 [Nocardia brasiliensis]
MYGESSEFKEVEAIANVLGASVVSCGGRTEIAHEPDCLLVSMLRSGRQCVVGHWTTAHEPCIGECVLQSEVLRYLEFVQSAVVQGRTQSQQYGAVVDWQSMEVGESHGRVDQVLDAGPEGSVADQVQPGCSCIAELVRTAEYFRIRTPEDDQVERVRLVKPRRSIVVDLSYSDGCIAGCVGTGEAALGRRIEQEFGQCLLRGAQIQRGRRTVGCRVLGAFST